MIAPSLSRPEIVAGHRLIPTDAPYARAHAAELRSRASDLGLGAREVFLGAVSHRDLPSLFAAADVGPFLSVCENCPNARLEAMASGRPPLISNREVMSERCGEAGLLVDHDRPEEVVGAWTAFSPSRTWRRSWDVASERILALLERVGAGRPACPS